MDNNAKKIYKNIEAINNKNFFYLKYGEKFKDNKNNLYVKGIPKTKSEREIYEFFYKLGDIFSVKVN